MPISLTEFADKLNEIMPQLAKEFFRKQFHELHKVKITLPQLFILDFLLREGEAKMTDLSNFVRVTTAAMTGVVDRLVKYGYVQRVYDASDRRIIKIRPTAKGNELVKKINQQKRRMIIDTFGMISQQEREQYLKILLRIQEILAKKKEKA